MCFGGSSNEKRVPRKVKRVKGDSFSAVAYADCKEGPKPTFLYNKRSSNPREARRAANCRYWGPLSREEQE
ncbi:hypothetical protein FPOAC2_11914 [Fusarium poae]|uniref:Uncharacterized protein n=1 Tax=Fusarium poae TaxID=36050 RepID=A0A1B8AEY9_FUSPO|nr:hypothetical protein FPOAC1_011606 [Fusarium poae]KAG8666789.1 hypothetical protein FPOAC1_011606 [Fusarium poae]OBS19035.1 hypothetical protein FPOA_10760 [Fusarium poae]